MLVTITRAGVNPICISVRQLYADLNVYSKMYSIASHMYPMQLSST